MSAPQVDLISFVVCVSPMDSSRALHTRLARTQHTAELRGHLVAGRRAGGRMGKRARGRARGKSMAESAVAQSLATATATATTRPAGQFERAIASNDDRRRCEQLAASNGIITVNCSRLCLARSLSLSPLSPLLLLLLALLLARLLLLLLLLQPAACYAQTNGNFILSQATLAQFALQSAARGKRGRALHSLAWPPSHRQNKWPYISLRFFCCLFLSSAG